MLIPATKVILAAPADRTCLIDDRTYMLKIRRTLTGIYTMLRCTYRKSSAPARTNGESLVRIQRCPATV
jgi:hypothetical protein